MLTVSSQGSVVTNANINVGKVVITAGGTSSRATRPGSTASAATRPPSTRGSRDLTEANAAAGNPNPPLGNNFSDNAINGGNPVQQALYNAIHGTGPGNILAGNDVFISAQYLNINGTIQSGSPSQSLTIDDTRGPLYNPNIPGWTATESMTDAINAAAAAYQQNQGGVRRGCRPSPTPGSSSRTWHRRASGRLYDAPGSAWSFDSTSGVAANLSASPGATRRAGGGPGRLPAGAGSFSQRSPAGPPAPT